MRAKEFVIEYKQYPTREYEGVTFTMVEKDGQLIVKALNDFGLPMGHVVFGMDGKELDPKDLEVYDKYQGQGIARVMYDYIKSQGFTIIRSFDQTDAGKGFWDKHRGEDSYVWEGVDADQVLQYVKQAHAPDEFDIDSAITDHPSWELKNIPISQLKLDPDGEVADPYGRVNWVDYAKVQDLVPKISAVLKRMPIVVDSQGWIIDGNHRATAAAEAGLKSVPAYVPAEVNESVPQPGQSSGAPTEFFPGTKIQTRPMTVQQIISSVPGVPYYNNVVDDWDAKDFSWGVTKKAIEYAEYLKQHPESLSKLPPIQVVNGQFKDGAHRVSAIWLLQQRMDPRNPLWKNAKLNVQFAQQDVNESKIKLSTDPNWYGAEVGDYRASSPVVNIPAAQLVGFEPDDKMNQPASRANVEKIVAGLKQGAKLPPLLVRKYKNGYQVLDGHHRFWAYKLLGVKSIPAQIVPDEDIDISENFADGKVRGKSRPGRVKRAGASCAGSVTDLRAKARKYGGERGKMYHWCANMKGGKKK